MRAGWMPAVVARAAAGTAGRRAFLMSMSVASILINMLSGMFMIRRTLLQRWWGGYLPRDFALESKWDVDCNPATSNWNTWEWREADGCFGRGPKWPCHETWAAFELNMPRLLLGLAIVGLGQLVNSCSVSARHRMLTLDQAAKPTPLSC